MDCDEYTEKDSKDPVYFQPCPGLQPFFYRECSCAAALFLIHMRIIRWLTIVI